MSSNLEAELCKLVWDNPDLLVIRRHPNDTFESWARRGVNPLEVATKYIEGWNNVNQ